MMEAISATGSTLKVFKFWKLQLFNVARLTLLYTNLMLLENKTSPNSFYAPKSLFNTFASFIKSCQVLTCLLPLLCLTEDHVKKKNCYIPGKCVQLFLWCSSIYLVLTVLLSPLSLFSSLRAGISRLPHSSAIMDWTSVFLPRHDKIRPSPDLMCLFKVCVCV